MHRRPRTVTDHPEVSWPRACDACSIMIEDEDVMAVVSTVSKLLMLCYSITWFSFPLIDILTEDFWYIAHALHSQS